MIKIYTDGSAKGGNPGTGGWGVVIFDEKEYLTKFYNKEPLEHVTNNQMELVAMMHALTFAINNPTDDFEIYSDSAYTVNMCNDWIYKWAENGWENSSGRRIENYELVKCIYLRLTKLDVPNFKILKVRGHSGDAANEMADALATGNKIKFLKYKEDLERKFNLIDKKVFKLNFEDLEKI